MYKVDGTLKILPVRNGVEARSPELELAAFGMDQEDAVEALKQQILAWLECLGSYGQTELAKALKRRHISFVGNPKVSVKFPTQADLTEVSVA